jgi:hypothetical protein
MTDDDKLPDELAQLFAAEKAVPVVDAAARAASRARIFAVVTSATLGKAAVASALGGAGKVLAVLALTVATGTGTVALLKSDEPAPQARPQPAIVRAPEPPPEPPVADEPPVVPDIVVAEPPPPAPPRKPVEQPPPPAPSQAALLKRAWSLLSAGQPDQALALVRDDERLHPDGVLAEEREALAIKALVSLRRTDEARVAVAAFVTRYPSSVHRAQVERALEETP